MQRILICDDEPDLAGLVELNLKGAGFAVDVVYRGEAVLQMAKARKPDLVLLDLMLPDISGGEVCRRLKADPSTADVLVLMLTARGEEAERVKGFEAGADDYVTKPFSVRELVLRVKALVRRHVPGAPVVLELEGLRLDPTAHRAFVRGIEVTLTALEFKLLHHFLANPGRAHTRELLLREVWGASSLLETRTVDSHMMRLREKLGDARDTVETVRGVGYRLNDGASGRGTREPA